MERVQKFISGSGAASRRKAEEFIKSGQVTINGRKARLGDKVDPAADTVKVYGKIIKPAAEKIYLMLNKPKGCVVSKSDPRGRKTIFSFLPEELRGKVWNVGRLDYNTEGLLILTNDGDLTQALSHPKYEHDKEYEVTIAEEPTDSQLEKLRQGVKIASGGGPVAVAADNVRLRDGKIRVVIHEGKKHQIKRMFDAVGLSVTNLKRIRVGKLVLPMDMPAGQHRRVEKEDIL